MRLFLLAVSFLLVMVACSENKKPKNPQQEARANITMLEEMLRKDPATYADGGRINDSIASSIVKAYLRYAEAYPKDSISPDYMFKAADVMRGQFRWDNAVQVLEELVRLYPEDSRVPNALFFAGFMLHNDLGQNERATPYLERLIAEYPGHRLAQDAAMLLQTMDMSEEDLIKMLEEKNGVTQ